MVALVVNGHVDPMVVASTLIEQEGQITWDRLESICGVPRELNEFNLFRLRVRQYLFDQGVVLLLWRDNGLVSDDESDDESSPRIVGWQVATPEQRLEIAAPAQLAKARRALLRAGRIVAETPLDAVDQLRRQMADRLLDRVNRFKLWLR